MTAQKTAAKEANLASACTSFDQIALLYQKFNSDYHLPIRVLVHQYLVSQVQYHLLLQYWEHLPKAGFLFQHVAVASIASIPLW